MSICIEKLAHSCEKNTTKDGLQVFQNEDGTCTGFCFPCNKFITDPYNGKPTRPVKTKVKKTPEQIQEELDELFRLGSPRDSIRSIRPDTYEYFRCKLAVSEEDGVTPSVLYFPYLKQRELKAYQAKLLAHKQMWFIGNTDDIDLFGWDQAIATGSKTLFITEGPLDAMSLYQALKDNSRGGKWEHLVPAVTSVPFGTAAHNFLAKKSAEIRNYFKEVVLVFDQDNAGKEAVRKCMQSLPMARSANIPAKDPNQCLEEGRIKALCNAVLFKSETPKNSRLVFGTAVHAEAREQPDWGLEWPWEGMTELTRGLRFGETIYIGAGVKMGKSELVNSLIAHLITKHQMTVFAAKPEETNKKTYQMVCGKVAGRIFHDPTKEFDFSAYDEASAKIGDSLLMLDLYQHLDWSTLRADILQAISLGCRAVFIDPITNITNGVSSGEANTILQGIAQDLAAIAKDNEIMAFIFCHLKAPESGAAHERGGKVLSHQFAGSRAMMRSCHMMIGLEGNKDPDLQAEQRNMRRLVILEDREFGASGAVQLYWDSNTGLFNEVKG